ncbi:MAG: hypothetical protein CSB34_06980 [Desulfobulbus propionicus]|nr:MAG: hypothetical protein CSB34_06980 [Desulfobulbus propionicus]
MRKAHNQQLLLAEAAPDHPKANDWKTISDILDDNPGIYDLVLQDPGSGSGWPLQRDPVMGYVFLFVHIEKGIFRKKV